MRSCPLRSELTSLTTQKLSKQWQTLQYMYTMKTITTANNPLYKPRLSWVAFHSTQFRKFRLVHQIGRGHFGENCCTQYRFCILLTRTITKREVVWFGTVQPKGTVPLATWNVRTFKPLNCSALVLPYMARQKGSNVSALLPVYRRQFFFDEEGEKPSVHRLPP